MQRIPHTLIPLFVDFQTLAGKNRQRGLAIRICPQATVENGRFWIVLLLYNSCAIV